MNKLLLLLVSLPILFACQSDDDRLETEARQALSEVVFDPTSYLVKNLRWGLVSDDERAICGEVNAKNRMGGFVGFQPFVAAGTPPKVIIAEIAEDASAYEAAYQRFCASPSEKLAYQERLSEERRAQAEQIRWLAEERRKSEADSRERYDTIARLRRQYEKKVGREAAEENAADMQGEANCIARLRGLARSSETMKEIEQTCRGG